MKTIFPAIFLFLGFVTCRFSSEEGSSPFDSSPYYQINKENVSRDAWQKPSEVIGMLGDIQDKVIADIGAGTGYFTFRMALRAKKVIAVEIDRNMIDLINAFKLNLPSDLKHKIETRLSIPNNSKLGLHEADIIVIINTITYIEDKKSYLKHLHKLLPREGRIMIVDYKTNNIPIKTNKGDYPLSPGELSELLGEIGYTNIRIDQNALDYQYILLADR